MLVFLLELRILHSSWWFYWSAERQRLDHSGTKSGESFYHIYNFSTDLQPFYAMIRELIFVECYFLFCKPFFFCHGFTVNVLTMLNTAIYVIRRIYKHIFFFRGKAMPISTDSVSQVYIFSSCNVCDDSLTQTIDLHSLP